jgi:hypothetical protein
MTDPGYGNRRYPYVFAGISNTLEAMGLKVFYLNTATATLESFRQEIDKFKPELLFGFIQNPQQVGKIAEFLKDYHPVAAINWYQEDPNQVVGADGPNMLEASRSFDMWFGIDSKMVPFWRTKAAYIPPAFDEFIFHDDGLERCFDVSYIGFLGPRKVTEMYWPYMNVIAGYGKKAMLAIDRPMGVPLLPEPLERFLRSKKRRRFLQSLHIWRCQWQNPVDEQEKAVIVNRSKIHFGLNRVQGDWEDDLKALLPDYPLDKHRLFYQLKGRLFYSVGAGAMALNEYCPELEDLFDVGREIITFEFGNIEEFRNKLSWYVTHDAERKRVALAGYERGRKQHTFSARIKQIFDIIRERL